MKICSNCGINKKLSEFPKNKCKCKECKKIWRKQWYKENKNIIQQYQKQWREENPEYQKQWREENPEYHKQWREQNNISEYQKQWREENPEYQKQWRKENPEIPRLHSNKYYQQNKDKAKAYYQENKQIINARINARHKERYHTDPVYRLKSIIRASIGGSIKNAGYIKISKTQKILGCTFDEFKNYIESKFESWMTWENQGLYNGTRDYGWDLDHIIPMSSVVTEDDVIRLNHYNNFQPLCSLDNRYIKKDNY